MNFNLNGKVALISGCSQGLGFACAQILAKHGVRIYGVSIGDDQELKQSIKDMSGCYHSSTISLTTPGAIHSVVKDALACYGQIDILLNFAGVLKKEDTLTITKQAWLQAMDINVHVSFFLSQEIIKVMKERNQGGKIINASGVLPFDTTTYCAYYTGKGAIDAMTKYLASTYAQDNIQVNAIVYGFMCLGSTLQHCEGNTQDSSILQRIPAARWGSAEDMEGLLLLLCSSHSDYITGTCIPIDGGYSI